MVDQKPPRLVVDEREAVMTLLQYQRESFVRKVSGVSERDARRPLVGSGTTLLWLTKHLTQAEAVWLGRRFAGRDVVMWDTVTDNDTLAEAVAAYRAGWVEVDAAVAAAPSLEEQARDPGPLGPVNLRWVLLHLLEETARHAGHADILRELIDGATGR